MLNNEKLKEVFESMTPDEIQVSRLKRNILTHEKSESHNKRSVRPRMVWIAAPAICLLLAIVLFFTLPYGAKPTVYAINVQINEDGTVLRLEDYSGSDSAAHFVSYVDARPGLTFHIDGEDIAKIEMTSENEYITATDWTKTQHEKYWNSEYYQPFSEEYQQYVMDRSLRYDQVLSMEFAEDFTDYNDIWYEWSPNRMYD